MVGPWYYCGILATFWKEMCPSAECNGNVRNSRPARDACAGALTCPILSLASGRSSGSDRRSGKGTGPGDNACEILYSFAGGLSSSLGLIGHGKHTIRRRVATYLSENFRLFNCQTLCVLQDEEVVWNRRAAAATELSPINHYG